METELFDACARNDFDKAKQLISNGKIDLNTQNQMGMTILMYAITMNRKEIAKELIAAGADPNVQDHYGRTAIELVFMYEITEIIDPLLKSSTTSNPTETDVRNTILLHAAQYGHLKFVKFMLNSGIDPNQVRNNYGQTTLMLATAYGHTQIAKELIAAGADPRYDTSLDLAIRNNRSEIASTLLNSGAIPTNQNEELLDIDPAILQGLDDEFGLFTTGLYYPELFAANRIGTDEAREQLAELAASLQVDQDVSIPETPNYATNPDRFFTVMAQRAYQKVMADDSIAGDERPEQAQQAALLTYLTLQRNTKQFNHVIEQSLQSLTPEVKTLMLSMTRLSNQKTSATDPREVVKQDEVTNLSLPRELQLKIVEQLLFSRAMEVESIDLKLERAQNYIQLLPVSDKAKEVVTGLQTEAIASIVQPMLQQFTTLPKEMRQLMLDPRTVIRTAEGYSDDALEVLIQRLAKQNQAFLAKLQDRFPAAAAAIVGGNDEGESTDRTEVRIAGLVTKVAEKIAANDKAATGGTTINGGDVVTGGKAGGGLATGSAARANDNAEGGSDVEAKKPSPHNVENSRTSPALPQHRSRR